MIEFWFRQQDKLLGALWEHLQLVLLTMICSLALAACFTVLSIYMRKLGEILIQICSLIYSIPSLAIFALLIPITGLGNTTAVLVLTVYNQYLLLRNFMAGLYGVDLAVTEAAEGMGMNRMQILLRIRLPLSYRTLITGIQLAVVSTVSIATIAAMINAGGLGTILFDGLRTLNVYKIVWGSILSAGLALVLNGIFRLVSYALDQRHKGEQV